METFLAVSKTKYNVITGKVLILLLTSMLPLVYGIQSARTSETIYIRADGNIEGTTGILTVDTVTYIFKHNIYQEIVVERDNILVDGAGYTLEGTYAVKSGNGIGISDRNNATIRNVKIKKFSRGIWVSGSTNSNISGNTIENNGYGVWLYPYSSNNAIRRNMITANSQTGIEFSRSSNNIVSENTIKNNINCGVTFYYSSNNNSIAGNIISNSEVGVGLDYYSSNNRFCHNTSVTTQTKSTLKQLVKIFGMITTLLEVTTGVTIQTWINTAVHIKTRQESMAYGTIHTSSTKTTKTTIR